MTKLEQFLQALMEICETHKVQLEVWADPDGYDNSMTLTIVGQEDTELTHFYAGSDSVVLQPLEPQEMVFERKNN
jgi:hypothetical protein